jgi:hypothetical protein
MAIFKSVLRLAELGEWTSAKLSGIRFARESDEETLERVLVQARKTICGYCNGSGRSTLDGACRQCHGTGEKPYDPNMPIVEEVMTS